MKLPLKNMLRGQQATLASLQDEALDIFYSIEPNAVLHGGTAIWRCYNGKRFSEDLDFYAAPSSNLKEKLLAESAKRGLLVSRFRKTQNNVYSKISDGRAEVSIEVSLRAKEQKVLASFERADGSKTDIYTLSAEDLLFEKANAFLGRKLIRDIYDVYFLSGIADLSKVRKQILLILEKLPKPVDEKNLRTLIYSGPSPTYKEMLEAIKRRLGQ